MKVREIQRSAASTVAWCPKVEGTTDVSILAAGTVSGSMGLEFDPTGKLEFLAIDFTQLGDYEVLSTTKTEEKLHKLAWSKEVTFQSETFSYGILAGAMESGTITLWNPAPLIDQSEGKVIFSSAEKHSGAVKGLDFNPFQASLLASGSLHGEVYIWDLSNIQPYAPGTQKSPSGEANITSVQWNNKIKHILGTSTDIGMAVIWDLRAKRAVLNFKDNRVRSFSSLAWSPTEPTQLVTASDDPGNPVIQLWDLKNTYAPSKILEGHKDGILSLSWSKHDSNLVLSCGRDSSTLYWDIGQGIVVGEVEPSPGWKLDVQWSPIPALASVSCLESKTIEVHSLQDFRNIESSDASGLFSGQKRGQMSLPYAPVWLGRRASAVFSFGGKLISIPSQEAGKPSKIKIHSISTDPDFVSRAEYLQSVIEQKNYIQFCEEKADKASTESDKSIWSFLKILFQKDARRELLSHLGFDKEEVIQQVKEHTKSLKSEEDDEIDSEKKRRN